MATSNDVNKPDYDEQEAMANSRVDAVAIAAIVLILAGMLTFFASR